MMGKNLNGGKRSGIARRTFLKGGAVAGASVALYAGGVAAANRTVLKGLEEGGEPAALQVEEQIFRSACNPECNHCALQVHVRNGRVARLTPDPDFYLRPCLRGYSRVQETYHPDRLKYPLKRAGARGEGKWVRISWDEALDTVAENLATVRDQNGPEAVLFLGGAVMSALRLFTRSRFANAFGKGVMAGTVGGLCCDAQGEAETAVVGYRFSALETFGDARLTISWGHNPAVTYIPHWRYIANALDAGARLITIDPRFSETAAKSDLWLSPLPGTDAALALGMINVILTERLYDDAFVVNKTNLPFLVNERTGKLLREADMVGGGDEEAFLVWDQATGAAARPEAAESPALEGSFEVAGIPVRTVFSRLKQRASRYDPQQVSKITGVPAEQIAPLAREYATTKPALINSCMSGAQRTSYGEYFVASLVYLAALTGNLGVRGGGLNDIGGPLLHGTLNVGGLVAPYEPDVKSAIPIPNLGEWLLAGEPYPIKAVYWQGKGLGQQPNSGKLRDALMKMDFVVVQESFMTDAAEIADVVLPTATLFEYVDLLASHINYYYQLMDKAVEPLWEAHSDVWIYSELAKRLGFGELFDKTDEEWVNFLLEPTGLTTAELREKGPAWMWGDARRNRFGVQWEKPPFWFFKDTPFQTPSGRVEFHSTRWEETGSEPMVNYFPPEESVEKTPDLAQRYPLALVNAKIRSKVHSTFALMPWLAEVYPEGWVDINIDDAAARDVKDGETVEVFNDRGSIRVKARVHSGIRPGVVSLQNGWWMKQGTNASILTNDRPTAISNGHTLNSTLVEVRRA